jgi:hypothetical protein
MAGPGSDHAGTGAASAQGAEERTMSNGSAGTASGGAIYGMGIIGALVYFWQQADSFWEYVWAAVQGLFWPAVMVYEAFEALAR